MAVRRGPIPDRDDDWRDRAACRHSDAELFFTAGSTGSAIGELEAAKAVCWSCPVLTPCLTFALETNQEAGVWGGTDEDERCALRRVWRSGTPQKATAAAT